MKIAEYIFCLFLWEIRHTSSLNLTPSAIVKTLHKGAYEAVKETVNTVTDVVSTPVDIKDVHFFLHTSKDHGYPNHTVDPLEPTELATRKGKVYFLIHGWTQSREKTPWYRPLTEYLLRKHPEAHVVQIDWGKAAANNYASAAFGTESVGNIIGDVIKKLVLDYNVPKKNVVVIGHSLGGQISGWVGKRFRKLTNSTLPRIIALDPAGPLFSSRPEDKRLNKHDADIVMVLHSDGGKLGFGSRCGSIDFFPNGGSDQPGCYKVDLADVSTLTEPIWCDHQRGYDLFLEAIKSPCLFLARKCEDYDKFKENKCEDIELSLGDLEASSAGSYYFKTTDKSPFIEINELRKNGRNIIGSSMRNHDIEECSQRLKLGGLANEKNEEVAKTTNQNHNGNSSRSNTKTDNNQEDKNEKDEELFANEGHPSKGSQKKPTSNEKHDEEPGSFSSNTNNEQKNHSNHSSNKYHEAVWSVSIEGVVKKIHQGVDEVVKGTVKGATEVVGTPVDPEDVKFFLVTSQNQDNLNDVVNQYAPKSIAQTQGNIFFFIHGWTQNTTACPWYKPLTDVLLKKYPGAHIVQVDWGKAAADNYASAAFSTESVGQIIANVIYKLVKENGVSLQKIVVIGHSLGGQITGWVGKEYRKLTNESLPRIIALDPAGPVFDVRPDSRRLNKNDAEVVMVIHSDRIKFGFPTNCGTIDFFPNGGADQPGCLQLNLTDLSLSSLTDPLWCSHRRAHDLFIEAIKQPQSFMATKCENLADYISHKCDGNPKVSMGDWQTSETGSYYLETTGEAPFIKT